MAVWHSLFLCFVSQCIHYCKPIITRQLPTKAWFTIIMPLVSALYYEQCCGAGIDQFQSQCHEHSDLSIQPIRQSNFCTSWLAFRQEKITFSCDAHMMLMVPASYYWSGLSCYMYCSQQQRWTCRQFYLGKELNYLDEYSIHT